MDMLEDSPVVRERPLVCTVLTATAWLFFVGFAFTMFHSIMEYSRATSTPGERFAKDIMNEYYVAAAFGSAFTSLLLWAASAAIQYLANIERLLQER